MAAGKGEGERKLGGRGEGVLGGSEEGVQCGGELDLEGIRVHLSTSCKQRLWGGGSIGSSH